MRSSSIGRNARSRSAPHDFELGRVAVVCSASCASLMSVLQSIGGPRCLLSNALAFSRAYAGVFCFLLIREISCSPLQPKVRRSAAQQGLAVRPICRTGWRGQHAMAPRHRDMARCSRHAATHPCSASFHAAAAAPAAAPRVARRPFDHAESDSEVNHARLCVMRHASCAHPLMRWRHCGVRGSRSLSGQKIAWTLIWFVEASRLHGGKRLRPTAHGARPPLAWPPCNPTGPRHFG